MKSILKKLVGFSLGFITCFILVIVFRISSDRPILKIKIKNQSGEQLEKVLLIEDRFNNTYIIENLPNDGIKYFNLYVTGEVGYFISAYFTDGSSLKTEVYAENGYKIEHIITKNKIKDNVNLSMAY